MIQGEMKTSFEGLVKLLARNLYSEDDVFIRELIQNANDSIVKRAVLSSNSPAGVIEIKVDRGQQTIIFEDNGAGMTQHELEEHLSTIGKS